MNLKVALIYGSTREGRFCDTVAEWALRELSARSELSVDVIDPGTLTLPRDSAALQKRIGDAEAFIVVSPEYNHSYPAALKSLIDSANHEWHAKPVAFISYGGISGGLRAVEHLRHVFAELHTVTLRDTVSFAGVWTHFDDAGRLRHPEAADRALSVMVERLKWWGTALNEARAAIPYSNVRSLAG